MDSVMGIRPAWRPFALGGLPHTDAMDAWRAIRRSMTEIPSWPQLPNKAFAEGPYAQWSEGFPGIGLISESLRVVRGADLDASLDALYAAYLEDDVDHCRVTAESASGLYALLAGTAKLPQETWLLKGQMMGPISWGLRIVDQNRRSVLYDQILGDAVAKHLRLKAAWQERQLARFCGRTMIMVQEPYLSALGSSLMSLTRHQIIALLEETFVGIGGLKGVHCCGDTDWSILMDTSADVISLDAYDYGEGLIDSAKPLNAFLDRGGMIAWGIVPASAAAMNLSAESLADRLDELLERLAAHGVDKTRLESRGFVTPACSLGALTVEQADRILDLTAEVSRVMRQRHLATSEEGDLAQTIFSRQTEDG